MWSIEKFLNVEFCTSAPRLLNFFVENWDFFFCRSPHILSFADCLAAGSLALFSSLWFPPFWELAAEYCQIHTRCLWLVCWLNGDRYFHQSHSIWLPSCDTVSHRWWLGLSFSIYLKLVTSHVFYAHDSFSLIGLG